MQRDRHTRHDKAKTSRHRHPQWCAQPLRVGCDQPRREQTNTRHAKPHDELVAVADVFELFVSGHEDRYFCYKLNSYLGNKYAG